MAVTSGGSLVSSISVFSLMAIVKPITEVLIDGGGPIGMKNCQQKEDVTECELGADEINVSHHGSARLKASARCVNFMSHVLVLELDHNPQTRSD